MKRPVSLSVAEPADTPVVMVAVAADETATIGSVPLPNSARVDEDCGNVRYYFVGNMKHVLYGMVVSSQKISPPYSCQRTVCKSHTIVCKNIFIQNLKIVFRPLPIVIVYSMFHVCDQSDSRTGTSFTNDVR